MTARATVTRTRSGNLRGSVDPQALAREFETLKSDVGGVEGTRPGVRRAEGEHRGQGSPSGTS